MSGLYPTLQTKIMTNKRWKPEPEKTSKSCFCLLYTIQVDICGRNLFFTYISIIEVSNLCKKVQAYISLQKDILTKNIQTPGAIILKYCSETNRQIARQIDK